MIRALLLVMAVTLTSTPAFATGPTIDYSQMLKWLSGISLSPRGSRLPDDFEARNWISLSMSVHDDIAYVADGNGGVLVIDVTVTWSPEWLGCWGPYAQAVAATDPFLVVMGREWIRIVDHTNPRDLHLLGEIELGTMTDGIVVGDRLVCVDGDGVWVVDVTDPTSPSVEGSLAIPSWSFGYQRQALALAGDLLVVTSTGPLYGDPFRLNFVDLSNPSVPVAVGSVDVDDFAHDVSIDGTHLYAALGHAGFDIYDVSDWSDPVLVGGTDLGDAYAVLADSPHLYVGTGAEGVRIFDIADPVTPIALGSTRLVGGSSDLIVDGDILHALGGDGPHAFDITALGTIDPIGRVAVGSGLRRVVASGSLAFLPSREGLLIADLSDPLIPALVGNLAISDFEYDWIDAADGVVCRVLDERLYLVDVTDPTNPVERGEVALGVAYAYDMVTDGEYVYVSVESDVDLVIVDIRDLDAPTVLGTFPVEGSAYHVEVSGNTAFVGVSWVPNRDDRKIQVIDITDPAAPVLLDTIVTQELLTGGTTHAGVAYLVTGRGQRGLTVYDLVTEQVISTSDWDFEGCSSEPSSGASAIHIVGGYAYVSHGDYLGVQVYDLADPRVPVFVGGGTFTPQVLTNGVLVDLLDEELLTYPLHAAGPTPVLVSEVVVRRSGGESTLSWVAGSASLRFRVHRDEGVGTTRTLLSGAALTGRTRYTYVDEASGAHARYWVEFRSSGGSSWYGPVAAPPEVLTELSAHYGGEAVEVRYTLPVAGAVEIGIYDVAGRRVARLFEGERPSGVYAERWEVGSAAHRPAAGVYFVRLVTPVGTRAAKVVIHH